MLRLHITPAEGEPFEHLVEGDEMVVGRSTRCDLSLADRFLSRQHARLKRHGDDWMIDDLGSRNGTFVNGKRISDTTPVRAGDVINISASVIRVTAGELERGAVSTTSEVLFRPASDVLSQVQSPPPDRHAVESPELRRYAERLAMLNEVHQTLARPIALDELLDLILDRAFQHLQPEQGVIFLRDADGVYQRVASRSLPGLSRGLVHSDSLIHEVADKGMAALVLDTESDLRFTGAQSLLDAGLRSMVAAPLLDGEEALGLIMIGSNAAKRRFGEEDLELLVTLASVAAMRIRNVALAEAAAERQRLENELLMARRIQLALLPEILPELSGYRLFGASRPSRGVSGDYYEVVERANGRECVAVLADVAGKGMAASLLTGYLEALTSAQVEAGMEPEEVFNLVCRTLARRTPPNRFATVFMAVLDLATGGLRFANAGHPPALVVRASGAVDRLGPTGMPLGLLADCSYTRGTSSLEPGGTLVIYSDGYTEAEGDDETQFGEERLAAICVAARREAPADLAATIDREVDAFVGQAPVVDDRTIVIVRREV